MSRVNARRTAALALGALCVGAAVQRPYEQSQCDQVVPENAEWLLHRASAFTVRIPPGFERAVLHGVDSEVAAFESTRGHFAYDFGQYSNPLRELTNATSTRTCSTAINGAQVFVVTGRDSTGAYVVAGHWANRSTETMGAVSLTIYGTAKDSVTASQLRAVLGSVRFGSK